MTSASCSARKAFSVNSSGSPARRRRARRAGAGAGRNVSHASLRSLGGEHRPAGIQQPLEFRDAGAAVGAGARAVADRSGLAAPPRSPLRCACGRPDGTRTRSVPRRPRRRARGPPAGRAARRGGIARARTGPLATRARAASGPARGRAPPRAAPRAARRRDRARCARPRSTCARRRAAGGRAAPASRLPGSKPMNVTKPAGMTACAQYERPAVGRAPSASARSRSAIPVRVRWRRGWPSPPAGRIGSVAGCTSAPMRPAELSGPTSGSARTASRAAGPRSA